MGNMSKEAIEIMRHIFDARIDNSRSIDIYQAWCNARDVVEYALANDIDVLKQFDYLETAEEREQNMWFEVKVHFCENDFENWKIRKEKDDASVEDFIEDTYDDEIYPVLLELPSVFEVDFEEELGDWEED